MGSEEGGGLDGAMETGSRAAPGQEEMTVAADSDAEMPEHGDPSRHDPGPGEGEPDDEGWPDYPGGRAWAESHRREERWRAGAEALDDACSRYAAAPFPAGPLTGRLDSREAAELLSRLDRGRHAAWDALRATDWHADRDKHLAALRTAEEVTGTADGVSAETLITRVRRPHESYPDFRDRARREPPRMPDTSMFPHPSARPAEGSFWRAPRPEHKAEAEAEAEPF